MNKRSKLVRKKHHHAVKRQKQNAPESVPQKKPAFKAIARIYTHQAEEFKKLFHDLELHLRIDQKEEPLTGLVKFTLTSQLTERYLFTVTKLQDLIDNFPGRFDFVRS